MNFTDAYQFYYDVLKSMVDADLEDALLDNDPDLVEAVSWHCAITHDAQKRFGRVPMKMRCASRKRVLSRWRQWIKDGGK